MPDPTTYADADGITYRPVARVPYAELVPGTPFALTGDARVYRRGTEARPGRTGEPLTDRLLRALYYGDVILLEAAGE